MPKYECVYIVEPEKTEDQVVQITNDLKAFVEKEGGTVEHIEQWGKKKNAYTIGKSRYGYYTLMHYTVTGPTVAKIERNLNLNESVLKFITVNHNPQTLLRPSSEVPSTYGNKEGGGGRY
ncbi:MAG: 30S ribosomal protein S6 [Nitrospinae bacterium]|nr:30S ribosomal protein S6 [Nitrospinota bacterium]